MRKSHKDKAGHNKGAEAMTNNTELKPNAKMLCEDRGNIRLLLEDEGKVLEAEDLKVADKAEKHADQEEDGCSIQP